MQPRFCKRRRCEAALPRLLAMAFTTASLASCGPAVSDPQGPIGVGDWQILVGAVVIMLAIVVPTIVATFAFAWWFRASNPRARFRPDFVYSGEIELVVWGIPLLVILLLGGVTWVGSHDLDPAQPIISGVRPIEVQVVSLDWKWLFIYPEQGIATVNELDIPVGTPVRFNLTSGSVMNAFFVPNLGSMIYTMNGMTTRLNLQADRTGTYYGMSAMFSGDGFPDMHFDVRAVPGDQFSSWVNDVKQKGPVLDQGGYQELARQSENVQPFSYRDIDPTLFGKIVSQQIPPAPGPTEAEYYNREVSPRRK